MVKTITSFPTQTVGHRWPWVFISLWMLKPTHLGFWLYTPPLGAERFPSAHRHSGVDGSSSQSLVPAWLAPIRVGKMWRSRLWFACFFPPLTWHKMQIDVSWGFIWSRKCFTLKGLTGSVHPIGAAWVHGTRWTLQCDIKQARWSSFWYVYLLELSSLFPDFIKCSYIRIGRQPVIADNYWLASISILLASQFKSAQWDVNCDPRWVTEDLPFEGTVVSAWVEINLA